MLECDWWYRTWTQWQQTPVTDVPEVIADCRTWSDWTIFTPTSCSLMTKSRYIQMLSCFYIPQFYVSLCTFNTHSTLSCSFLTCFLYPSLLPINPLGHGNNVRAVIRRERERDWKREIDLIKTKRSTRGNKKYTMRPIKGDLVFICSCVWWEENRRDGGVNKTEKQEGVRQRPRQSEREKKATGAK